MNGRLLALAALALPLTLVTGLAMWEHGFIAIFESALTSSSSLQVFVDLATSLTLVLCWLVPDARERGLPWWPFLLGTLALGSFSPLAYLVVREVSGR